MPISGTAGKSRRAVRGRTKPETLSDFDLPQTFGLHLIYGIILLGSQFSLCCLIQYTTMVTPVAVLFVLGYNGYEDWESDGATGYSLHFSGLCFLLGSGDMF